tara:strand:+ start:286 stop:534 length:249 start_codon:yes stop_codon:yes gene_type:complete
MRPPVQSSIIPILCQLKYKLPKKRVEITVTLIAEALTIIVTIIALFSEHSAASRAMLAHRHHPKPSSEEEGLKGQRFAQITA